MYAWKFTENSNKTRHIIKQKKTSIFISFYLSIKRKKRPPPRRLLANQQHQQPMKPVQAVPPTSKATPTHQSKHSNQGEYRKLGDIEIGGHHHPRGGDEKLPPPPPEMLMKDGVDHSNGACVNGNTTGSAGTNTPRGGSCGDYERITARMPSPPPSPLTHSPHTDTTSISTLSNTGSLPSNKRTQSLSSASTLNVRQSPSAGVISSQTPTLHRCHNPHSNAIKSPLSAGYNPRNSFEFPPPPPEALKHPNGYSPMSAGQSSTLQRPSQKEGPDYDILRYRIVDPKQDPYAKYGSLGSRGTGRGGVGGGQNCKQNHERKPQERVHFENDSQSNVPYEYGYHLKTGQKFKIYQQSPNLQNTGNPQNTGSMTSSPKTMTSRDERNRKMPSATSSTPLANKKAPNRKTKSNTGTM